MHTVAVRAEQLGIAGIGDVPPPTLDWLDGDVGEMALPDAFSLIVPGRIGASH